MVKEVNLLSPVPSKLVNLLSQIQRLIRFPNPVLENDVSLLLLRLREVSSLNPVLENDVI